jgi:hypothetical protein
MNGKMTTTLKNMYKVRDELYGTLGVEERYNLVQG